MLTWYSICGIQSQLIPVLLTERIYFNQALDIHIRYSFLVPVTFHLRNKHPYNRLNVICPQLGMVMSISSTTSLFSNCKFPIHTFRISRINKMLIPDYLLLIPDWLYFGHQCVNIQTKSQLSNTATSEMLKRLILLKEKCHSS